MAGQVNLARHLCAGRGDLLSVTWTRPVGNRAPPESRIIAVITRFKASAQGLNKPATGGPSNDQSGCEICLYALANSDQRAVGPPIVTFSQRWSCVTFPFEKVIGRSL